MDSINLHLLSQEEVTKLNLIISESQKIIITCHKSPDGDAIGSVLACAEWLRQRGKDPIVVVPDMFPDFLRWLPGVEKIRRYDKHKEELDKAFAEADTIFCLDFNDTSRVNHMQPALDGAKGKKVLIDHHLEPTVEAEWLNCASRILRWPPPANCCSVSFGRWAISRLSASIAPWLCIAD